MFRSVSSSSAPLFSENTTICLVSWRCSHLSVTMAYSNPRNTLAKEGIRASNAPSIVGSSFGKASSTPHRASAHQKAPVLRKVSNSSSSSRNAGDFGQSSRFFLSRPDWIALGEGWFQCTPMGTGTVTRFGLHSVLESSSFRQLFVCLYEPRSPIAVQACTSHNPEYDLELFAKLQSKSFSGSTATTTSERRSQNFTVIFAFKSVNDYCALRCNGEAQTWSLLRTIGESEFALAEVEDASIRTHVFSHLLIQVMMY